MLPSFLLSSLRSQAVLFQCEASTVLRVVHWQTKDMLVYMDKQVRFSRFAKVLRLDKILPLLKGSVLPL